ncbi:hypothetical protein FACS1894188_11650 [Clostridia bacterium]|nr:hypothetical protein FACS1894188_11650 [Clostridia bacterium]
MEAYELKDVYARLCDDESRMIFENKLLHALTGDHKYIKKMALECVCVAQFANRVRKGTDKETVIFGAGVEGKDMVTFFENVKFSAFVDDIYAGKTAFGLPILTQDEFFKRRSAGEFDGADIIIGSSMRYNAMWERLLAENVPEDSISGYPFGIQYFDCPELVPAPDEVFVDGGTFSGDTVFDFIKWSNNQYSKIFAFEPDRENYEVCKKNLEKYDKVELFNNGLWDKRETLRFLGFNKFGGKAGAGFDKAGEQNISALDLDSALAGERVSFIKLDVEGAELNALRGMRKIITEQKPKLAVCIYHKPEDIWELPRIVLEYNKDYKLYMRHYCPSDIETVMYAL